MHRTAVQIRRGFFIGRYYIPGDGGEGNGTKSATRSDNCGNNKAIVGGALPYLTILEHTSSIYTLMSFLSILGPAKPLSSAVEQHPKQHATSSKNGRILSAAPRDISSVLVTNPARDDDKCARLRSELRDSFVPALGRLFRLVGDVIVGTVQQGGVGDVVSTES